MPSSQATRPTCSATSSWWEDSSLVACWPVRQVWDVRLAASYPLGCSVDLLSPLSTPMPYTISPSLFSRPFAKSPEHPNRGSKYPILEVLIPQTIKGVVSGIKDFKFWVLGPFGFQSCSTDSLLLGAQYAIIRRILNLHKRSLSLQGVPTLPQVYARISLSTQIWS